eukprot:TRINITY_DN28903_c0_g1_i1.p1 TRINITY_DN28903_c0_g1~~TRINITY_DN28903_c0_g1_i1.p1  ORF type:complete len:425 (+),score=34.53 TRINITY_DN28903_c0_g1_i1:63-1277(+)
MRRFITAGATCLAVCFRMSNASECASDAVECEASAMQMSLLQRRKMLNAPLQDGSKYRFVNYRYNTQVCLDRASAKGGTSVQANPCDDHGGDVWTAEATGEFGVYRLTNQRSGYAKACLDRHLKTGAVHGNVGAYSCDNSGGDLWEVTTLALGINGPTVTLKNSRFGEALCLDRHGKWNEGSVYANWCDGHDGNAWVVEQVLGGNLGLPCNGCENGWGTWQHYEDAQSLSCICVSCQPGFTLEDMFCVEDRDLPIIEGLKYRFTNYNFGKRMCLDRAQASGGSAIQANPCDYHGGDIWTPEAVGVNSVYRLTNEREGYSRACLGTYLEHGSSFEQLRVGECDSSSGNLWKVSRDNKGALVFSNYAFNITTCLHRRGYWSWNSVDTTPCDETQGEWYSEQVNDNE